MRLTEKNEFGYILHIKSVDNPLGNEIAIVGKTADKLGQLEDIEEELGIELTTLFRMLKDGFYIKTETGIVFIQNVEQWEKLKQYSDFTSEYGKTWALTREELL